MQVRQPEHPENMTSPKRRRLTAVTLAFITSVPLSADPSRQTKPIHSTVSELATHPRRFAGKMVVVESEVMLGRGPLLLGQENHRILVSTPDETAVSPKAKFVLLQHANWHLLNQAVRPLPPGSAQPRRVRAVIEGRFDSTLAFWRYKLLRINLGFGHMGLYDHRLVVHRVICVETIP